VDISKVGDAVRDEGNVLIDVRETPELEETGFIPGAVHYPMSNFESTIASLDKDKKYYVICRSGKRSESVQNKQLDNGDDPVIVPGGMSAYERQGNPIRCFGHVRRIPYGIRLFSWKKQHLPGAASDCPIIFDPLVHGGFH